MAKAVKKKTIKKSAKKKAVKKKSSKRSSKVIASPKKVLVAGDVIIDHHIYQGTRSTPDSKDIQGALIKEETGGAKLLHRIIEQVSKTASTRLMKSEGTEKSLAEYTADFGLDLSALKNMPSHLHSYAVWTACSRSDLKEKVWRMTLPMGYGIEDGQVPVYKRSNEGSLKADIVVLDDAALGYRHSTNRNAWPKAIEDKKDDGLDWVVLKMSSPVASGDLFRFLTKKIRKKLVLVVSIGDLRREEVGITKGLSWERTVQELLTGLQSNPRINSLLKCRHLIITFNSEGALWISRDRGKYENRLIFDPACLEGEANEGISGRAFGYMSCMVAGIVNQLIMSEKNKLSLGAGVMSGLSAMRLLNREGHGNIININKIKGQNFVVPNNPDFPYDAIADEIINASTKYSIINVPSFSSKVLKKSNYWTIVEDSLGCSTTSCAPMYGLARRVALYGDKALSNIPYASFGKLFTIDRSEIESLRGIRHLIKEYEADSSPSKPLSLAVFGAPGSGKSFGIKQIAKAVLGEKVPILEFNLSQFSKSEELIGAFHQVRDVVLKGKTPVVFWDEFDSQQYSWLQYLLAPMQDGEFREGQIVHPIGKCLFVFAGGTSYKMENFIPSDANPEDFKKFKLVKGPDFVSRLSGYLNVLGPNRRQTYDQRKNNWVDDNNPPDICFPVRRALLLRNMLKLSKDDILDIDKGLLTALLEIKQYNHGARSLETIVKLSWNPKTKSLKRSDIPPREQMSLHVDYKDFMNLINRDLPFKMNSEILAPVIHEYYRQLCKRKGYKIKFDMDYSKLPDNEKASNIAAAERVPEVLGLADLLLVPQGDPRTLSNVSVKRIINNKIETLSEAEHSGWMEQKYQEGYVFGSYRDDSKRIHNALIPYYELREEDKEKDRDSVRNYPDIAKLAGYKIVRI